MQRAHYPRPISNKTGMSHEILVRPPNIKSDENRFSRYQAYRRTDGWIYVRKDVIFSKFDTDKRMIQTVIQIAI
jgi:hypothetical protein